MENFRMTGEIQFNDMSAKNPPVRTGKTKSGDEYLTVSFAVVAETNNRAYVELFGIDSDVVKTMDVDRNNIEIKREDCFDKDVIDTIAGFRKHVCKVEDDRREFIRPYDLAKYISDNMEMFKGKKFTVTGTVNKNIYNGSISDRFQLQNIYSAEEDAKNRLNVNIDFVWDKDGIDFDNFAEDKKIYINGYTYSYIDKDNGNKYVPRQIILDCGKIDFSNEKHAKLANFKAGLIGVAFTNGKPKYKIKANKWYSLRVSCLYMNGAELEEFTEDMLTEMQREQLELGLKTLDQLRPSGNIYGNRVTVFKLQDADLRGEYQDGMVEVEDIEENIYIPTIEENADDVLNGAMNKPEKEVEEDDDDLFA